METFVRNWRHTVKQFIRFQINQRLIFHIPSDIIHSILSTIVKGGAIYLFVQQSTVFQENKLRQPRDEMAKQEEAAGTIEFFLIGNSLTKKVSKQTMMWLISMQNVILRQLPKMPMQYISRLVFDWWVYYDIVQ